MGDVQTFFTMICFAALILLVVVSVCRFIGLWRWTATWMFSSREEKMNLTKSKGHYNANGYFVSSDSLGDINLCYSGSFKRFDSVDHDCEIAVTSLTTESDKCSSYPQEISLPFGTVQNSDLSEFTKPGSNCLYKAGLPQKFSSSQPVIKAAPPGFMQSSVSFEETTEMYIPPQPLRPAPAPPPSLVEKTEEEAKKKPSPPPVPPRGRARDQLVTQASLEREEALTQVQGLKRAVSCESVCSDTSVALGDLEEPHITGYLCIGLEYDSAFRINTGSSFGEDIISDYKYQEYFVNKRKFQSLLYEVTYTGTRMGDCADLSVSVLEAKDLIGPDPDNQNLMDTYVRVYLLPDKTTNIQTRVYKKSNSPSYKEKFLFALEPHEFPKRSLTFYVYASDKSSNTLIGEADLRLSDISSKQGVTTWVTLTDTGQNRTEWGELMLSLSYLPTAERLTVVVVKARNLVFPNHRDSGDPFVKVYLLKQGKKIHKKKTSTKKGERSPIFNEAMIFNVPASYLQTIQLRLTVAENTGEPRAYALGHVILGSQASGKALSHWAQMLSSLRKPIAMWHSLRK